MRVNNNLVLELDDMRLGLDTSEGDMAFMSHAHADHIVKNVKHPVLTSKLTAELAKHRTGENYDIKLSHPGFELIDSGHVIGSKALMIKGEEKILYTGDFTTQDRFFLKGLKPVKCDTLIIESTYGIPEYDLPKPNDIIMQARDVILDDLARGYNPCLVGYALGKAQLITKIAQGLGDVYAHDKIRGINEVCNRNGYDLPVLGDSIKGKNNFIYITPNIKDALKIPNARTYSFTGWGVNRTDCFPLSDHAGFSDLFRFVKACAPEKVFTHHGFSVEFAEFLKGEGINAKALH